jgi:hypothetical protein
VLREKSDAWVYEVSPPVRQRRLETLTDTLRQLVDSGLAVASVITNLHHRWIIPLMERELRIYEMSDAASPVALVHSRQWEELLASGYAATGRGVQ